MATFGITGGPLDNDTHVIEPHGEIDLATAPDLKARLVDAIEEGRRFVVLDLEDVGYIASSGLGHPTTPPGRYGRTHRRMRRLVDPAPLRDIRTSRGAQCPALKAYPARQGRRRPPLGLPVLAIERIPPLPLSRPARRRRNQDATGRAEAAPVAFRNYSLYRMRLAKSSRN